MTNAFGLVNVGIFSSPTLVDIDHDGDFDSFIGTEGGDVLYFENRGTAQSPNFAGAIANPFGLTHVGTFSSPEFSDIDADGDLDAFIGTESGETFFFENIADSPTASPHFITYEVTLLGGSNTFVSLGSEHDFVQVSSKNTNDHTILTGEGRNIVELGVGNDEVHGGSGKDILRGGDGDDILYSYGGEDLIEGGAGNDLISGGFGYDFLDGGEGIDTVDYRNWSGGGTYNLELGTVQFPNSYTEIVLNFENIQTGSGHDTIIGSSDDNVIEAGSGNDQLLGASGDDHLTGGYGADDFRFTSLADGIDTISDFYWDEGDKIQIDASSFGATSLSQFAYNYSTGALSFNASPNDGIMPQTFAILENRPSDFYVSLDVELV